MPAHNYSSGAAWLAAATLAATFSACLKPPDYPVEPVVEFLGLSKDTLIQGLDPTTDETFVVLGFTDGDGDIAFGAEDSTTSVFIENIETGVIKDQLNVDPIDETGIENGISGQFLIRVATTCCIYPENIVAFPCDVSTEYPIDTLYYEAYMRDRAGNESNRVALPPIYLQCDR